MFANGIKGVIEIGEGRLFERESDRICLKLYHRHVRKSSVYILFGLFRSFIKTEEKAKQKVTMFTTRVGGD